ncbi:hypothetical protein LX83_001771 [Goodfellowiella coeruleoviolacea]|uniref:Uncharacterized protein n=1 Tax=Goodfellowiella coeruleoviolacea TaxID=334858 RepID=A0AAE3GCW0_9PSEU|nr:hypothetical protein [Goodfellowiella coeruleoviolacea]
MTVRTRLLVLLPLGAFTLGLSLGRTDPADATIRSGLVVLGDPVGRGRLRAGAQQLVRAKWHLRVPVNWPF